jgi:methionyl-tRNA formyltransferase
MATSIGPTETAGALAERLAELGATTLVDALSLLSAGRGRPQPQDHSQATYAPKIDREMARLSWSQDSTALARQVRAFDPAPGAWTMLNGSVLKLFGGEPVVGRGAPGAVLEAGDRLVVAAGSGAVAVTEVQPAGKSRLPVDAWVRGRGISVGQQLA